jgi:hypothetical protein
VQRSVLTKDNLKEKSISSISLGKEHAHQHIYNVKNASKDSIDTAAGTSTNGRGFLSHHSSKMQVDMLGLDEKQGT